MSDDVLGHTDERSRPATKADLEILQVSIDAQYKALTTLVGGQQEKVAEHNTRLETNTGEINRLREHFHDMAGKVQLAVTKTDPLTLPAVVEVMRLLPILQAIAQERDKAEYRQREIGIGRSVQFWGILIVVVEVLLKELPNIGSWFHP